MSAKKLKVTQIKSGIGRMDRQRRVLKGLGLRGPNSCLLYTSPSPRDNLSYIV